MSNVRIFFILKHLIDCKQEIACSYFFMPLTAKEVALNFGQPFILTNPDLQICLNLEKMAYQMSDDAHKAIPPAVPSPTWKRVTSQLATK
jgi:hypothetical protein